MVRLFFAMLAGFGVGAVALSVGLALGGWVTYEMTQTFIEPEKVNYQTLEFNSSPAKIYLSARVWGFASGGEEIRICDGPVDLSVPGNCLSFDTRELFYGRNLDGKPVMHVYTNTASTDETARLGDVEVTIHQIDSDKYERMRRDYDVRSLMRISAP